VRGVTRPGGAPEAPASLAHGRCAPRLALGCRVRGRGPLRAPRAWGSGRSWDAENAPDTRGAGGPHSDVSTCLTSLLHRPSPGRSSPWEPQPGSARWRLDGAGRGQRAGRAWDHHALALLEDDVFSMAWHTACLLWFTDSLVEVCFLPRVRGAVTAPRSVWWLPWALRSVAPTTCSPCGFRPPSPAALSVLRRRLAGPAEAPPSRRRRAAQARHFRGSPLPAPQLGACPKKSQFISR
jgi:hypothetical protein